MRSYSINNTGLDSRGFSRDIFKRGEFGLNRLSRGGTYRDGSKTSKNANLNTRLGNGFGVGMANLTPKPREYVMKVDSPTKKVNSRSLDFSNNLPYLQKLKNNNPKTPNKTSKKKHTLVTRDRLRPGTKGTTATKKKKRLIQSLNIAPGKLKFFPETPSKPMQEIPELIPNNPPPTSTLLPQSPKSFLRGLKFSRKANIKARTTTKKKRNKNFTSTMTGPRKLVHFDTIATVTQAG